MRVGSGVRRDGREEVWSWDGWREEAFRKQIAQTAAQNV